MHPIINHVLASILIYLYSWIKCLQMINMRALAKAVEVAFTNLGHEHLGKCSTSPFFGRIAQTASRKKTDLILF